jgi:hypothetical protein
MKALSLALLIVTVSCDPAFAQAMPDRGADVTRLVTAKYAALLNGDDHRRREVLDQLCGDLNLLDGGQWARVIKHDRNPPGLPADALVWKPTREHVDVLTDFGPAWIPHGVLPTPEWGPLPCASAALPPPVVVVPPPVEPPPADFSGAEIIRRLVILEMKADQTLAAIDDAKVTIVDAIKGALKWLSGPAATAIVTWLIARKGGA